MELKTHLKLFSYDLQQEVKLLRKFGNKVVFKQLKSVTCLKNVWNGIKYVFILLPKLRVNKSWI